MIRVNLKQTPLAYRPLTHLEPQEAAELLNKVRPPASNKKPPHRQETILIRGGVLQKVENHQNPFLPQQTKVIPDFDVRKDYPDRMVKRFSTDLTQPPERPLSKGISQQKLLAKREIHEDDSPKVSMLEQFMMEEEGNLREDYCRLWFQKLALESINASLMHQNHLKEDMIAELRRSLEGKGHVQGGFGFNHPISVPNNPTKTPLMGSNVSIQQRTSYPARTFALHTARNNF